MLQMGRCSMKENITEFNKLSYDVFQMFYDQYALVTSGTIDDFNCCTIGWGSLGNIWTNDGNIVTVYVHPKRYTWEYLMKNDRFTVCFFEEQYRKDLVYLGSVSGRDVDKVSRTPLTTVEADGTVLYKEASLAFVCEKMYQGQFQKEGFCGEMME